MHKNLHSAMYAMWRNKSLPQETDAETNANTKTQLSSQAVLWQIKNPHMPKRKKKFRIQKHQPTHKNDEKRWKFPQKQPLSPKNPHKPPRFQLKPPLTIKA
jgi:hypothetical protein